MDEASRGSNPQLPGGTVTFLFTDIEGSTRLLAQLGPDYVNLLAGHHRLLRQAIANWQGTEVGTEGDAFFVTFPRATDALSAVIEAQRALTGRDWPQGVSVRVRMGLHTGEPWTTDTAGYVGMDVHRAARIAHVGHGGQVLLSETTAALLRSRLPEGVELLDLGYHHLKDMAQPEHIHQLAIDGLPSDFPPLASLGQVTADQPVPEAPKLPDFLAGELAMAEKPLFVGREREIGWLDHRLQSLLNGQSSGHVVFVAGEAGMGKTTLMQAFARQATETAPELLVAWGACNAFIGPGDAYLPFRQVFGLLSGDVEQAWRAGTISTEQARRLWAAFPTFGQAVVDHGRSLMTTLVDGRALLNRARSSLPRGGPWLARVERNMARSDRQEADFSGVRIQPEIAEVLITVAEKRPLLLLLDDMQWADSASLNLLFQLARELTGSRALIVCAYRPEDVALGRGDEKHPLEPVLAETRRLSGDVLLDLSLSEIGEKRDFVDAVLDSEPNALDEGFRDALFAHTGGQALFTVEILRYLQERGDLVQDGDGVWATGPTLSWDTLPDRVEGVIEARIGRLEDELRELLNVAAVEGEDFTAQVIARVQAINERSLLRTLSRQLEKRHQLIRERSAVFHGRQLLSRYRFSHALFQQYLYNDLSPGERQLLHAEIAAILEELYAGQTEEIAVLLARHYRAAGQVEKALPYLLHSGDQARDLQAFEQAAGHYQEALAILRPQGDRDAIYQTLMKLGQTYHSAFAFKQAGDMYREAFHYLGKRDQQTVPSSPMSATVRWAIYPERFNTLDFSITNDERDGFFISHLFSGLVQLSPQMDILPDIATNWQISDDGLTYRFQLREDVVWSDGQPVTAHDFEFAWRRILDPRLDSRNIGHFVYIRGATDLLAGTSDQLGVKVLGDWTLQIELERPIGYFLLLLARYGTPLPRHAVEKYGDAWSEPENLVANGPYLLDKVPETWSPGESLILRRNPSYHGDFPGNVEYIHMLIVETPEEELKAYENDEIDLTGILGLSPLKYRRVVTDYGKELYTYPGQNTLVLGFDTRRPPFDDPEVRRVFVLATDRSALADVRSYVASGGFIPPGLPGYVPDIALPYDVERARKLLAAAGFPEGTGFPVIRGATGPFLARYLEIFDRLWGEGLGIPIQWKISDSFEQARGWNFCIWAWNADYPDPDNFLRLGLNGLVNWRQPAYDELIDRANRTKEHRQRMQLFRQAEEILVAEAPIIPLLYLKREWLIKPWLKNFQPISFGNALIHHAVVEPH